MQYRCRPDPFLHPAEHTDRNIGFAGPANFGAVGLSGSTRTAPLVAQMESRTADPVTLPLQAGVDQRVMMLYFADPKLQPQHYRI